MLLENYPLLRHSGRAVYLFTAHKTQLIWRFFSIHHYSPVYYPNPLADLLTISFGDKMLRHKLNYDVSTPHCFLIICKIALTLTTPNRPMYPSERKLTIKVATNKTVSKFIIFCDTIFPLGMGRRQV
jgi:hypothetical protein